MTTNIRRCLLIALCVMVVKGNVRWVEPEHAWWDYNYGDGASPFSEEKKYPWRRTKRSLPTPTHGFKKLPPMEEIAEVKNHIAKTLL